MTYCVKAFNANVGKFIKFKKLSKPNLKIGVGHFGLHGASRITIFYFFKIEE